MIPLKIMYLANIIITAWLSFTCLFQPQTALRTIFENSIAYSDSIRLIGALWGAIFVLSILGLLSPEKMSVILLFQLIYKSSWLLIVALPAVLNNNPYPKGMANTFLVWVLILPFVIPWKYLFS